MIARRDDFRCCIPCEPPKRYPGCSAPCPEYKAAKEKYNAKMNQYAQEHKRIKDAKNFAYDSYAKVKKRSGK